MSGATHTDARLNLRSAAQGYAVIPFVDARIPAQIVNISLAGALLQAGASASLPTAGTILKVEMRLAEEEHWHDVTARVRRRDARNGILAIQLITLDDKLEEAIAGLVLEGIIAADSPRVLLVDLDPARRNRSTRVLRLTGCSPVEAATPLEAIHLCEESSLPIGGAAIVDDGTQDFGELAAFLDRTYGAIEVTRIDPSSGHALDDLRLLARAVRNASHH
jgi:hypothetical protein